MVPMTDFLTGVLSALIIYFVVKKFFSKKKDEVKEQKLELSEVI